jgi:pimeloyl-ACP methyl ester carboxylesterase
MTLESPHFKTNIQGIDVYYELHKHKDLTKPILVLIHGFLSSTFSYRRLIPLLKEEYTVLAIDLPPFGRSDKSTKITYSYKNLANVVIQLLKLLMYSRVSLIGHSMGGQISLYIAKQAPDLIEKVILLSSSGYMKRLPLPLIYSSYFPFFHLYVKRHLAKQGIDRNLFNVVHDHSIIDEDMKKGYLEPFSDDNIFRALTRMIRHREGDLLSEDLQKIETPSLLIWGQEDKVVPISIGERLHKDLPNSTFISLDKTGHLVPEEKPLLVHKKIIQFI